LLPFVPKKYGERKSYWLNKAVCSMRGSSMVKQLFPTHPAQFEPGQPLAQHVQPLQNEVPGEHTPYDCRGKHR
jgi:hypothetical protein